MAEELEIKLTISEENIPAVERWVSTLREARFGEEKHLVNRYFDTPAADLNREKAALRVRQAGDRFIQTLKTRGDFVAGAHRRQEWEWPLPGPNLQLGLLADSPLAERVNLAELSVIFETNFQRRTWWIVTETAEIEVALDSGQVVSGDQVVPLHEVEFELKAGDSGALMSYAQTLAAKVPVFLNLVSKAEQGYHLAGLYHPRIETGSGPLTVEGFLQRLSLAWLTGTPPKFREDELKGLRSIGHASKVLSNPDSVFDAIESGTPIRSLVSARDLGQLQLALAHA
ncbi:adenylate cyclase [Marinobacter santoriniensis NKSG1]|uniref:Adenylate cyclase n=1 Tax=Marinobacter santoriniensis NKSG1 TaxID=1288826 RepID=M7CK13_9GAMM|nr:CYTH domain-containing protein [Marinobacter santoriniensis]EMP54006.1 adenylate cyclase [Marinobacter santoriniensis NKSG1]